MPEISAGQDLTVKDFINWLNENQVHEETKIRISALGGMRSGKRIASISNGFDWDMGAIILNPAATLMVKPSTKDQRPGECYQCYCARMGHQYTNGPCRCTPEYIRWRRDEKEK